LDGDDSYHEGDVTNSNSETEDDDMLVDEHKKATDTRKRPPEQAAESVLVAGSGVEPTPEAVVARANLQAVVQRAALIKSEAGRNRAEQQVRTISRVKLADNFLIRQVHTWSKEVLWKQCSSLPIKRQ
jgi:hypothetical protein